MASRGLALKEGRDATRMNWSVSTFSSFCRFLPLKCFVVLELSGPAAFSPFTSTLRAPCFAVFVIIESSLSDSRSDPKSKAAFLFVSLGAALVPLLAPAFTAAVIVVLRMSFFSSLLRMA